VRKSSDFAPGAATYLTEVKAVCAAGIYGVAIDWKTPCPKKLHWHTARLEIPM
jgi:hypothetical protein